MDGLVAGRIVYFVFDTHSAKEVAQQRVGYTANAVYEGDTYPAMVVRTWNGVSGNVNLKVMLDGPDTYWATSVHYDATKTPRTWHWMFDGQATRHAPPAGVVRARRTVCDRCNADTTGKPSGCVRGIPDADDEGHGPVVDTAHLCAYCYQQWRKFLQAMQPKAE